MSAAWMPPPDARRLSACSDPPSCRADLSLPHPAAITIANNGRAARFMNTFGVAGDPRAADRLDSRQSAERNVPVILFCGAYLCGSFVAPPATGTLRYTYV